MQETETTSFGEALKAERNRRGWSQQELADKVGVTQQNVGNWERGANMPKQAALDKLIEVLGQDSPIASTRLKPELRVLHFAGESTVDYPSFSRRQTEPNVLTVARMPLRPPIRETHLKLAELLPSELKQNLERRISLGRASYLADYLSDKLCVGIKKIIRSSSVSRGEQGFTMFNLRRSQRDALFQLTAIRKINENLNPSGSSLRYVAVYMAPDEETAMWAESNAPLLEEARLFDVDFRVVSTFEKVASIIKFYEKSELSPDEGTATDEIDSEDWLGN